MASLARVASGIARPERPRARSRARRGAHRRVTTRSWTRRDAGTVGPPRTTRGSNPEDEADRAKIDAPYVDSRSLGRRRLALGALGASLGSRALGSQTEPSRALVDEANATRVFEAASRSVVSLAVYDPDGPNGGYAPRGTGVVWAAFAEGGFVVTNFHLVKDFVPGAAEGAGAKSRPRDDARRASGALRVNVPEERDGDATWYDAVVVGTQRASDLAVLRLMRPPAETAKSGAPTEAKDERRFSRPAALPLGASGTLRIGQSAYVVGAGDVKGADAMKGAYRQQTTMSAGVISGLRRSVPSKNGTTIRNAVQTDAEVPESAAGAALVDSAGRLIGVTVTTYGNTVSPGLGFAVPVDDLLKIVPALITLHQIS